MFSFSNQPINKSSVVDSIIDFISLIKTIMNPPNKNLYLEIHRLRSEGKDSECKLLKKSKLPWITPNCVVKQRSLEAEGEFEKNYLFSSGFIYFDIDIFDKNLTTDELKKILIRKYGHIVALISKSSSNRGISILIRINSKIYSKEEYSLVYDYIFSTYFSNIENGVEFDSSINILGAPWFVPFDESVYVNYESEIDVSSVLNNSKVSNDVLYPPHTQIHGLTPKPKSKPKKIDYAEINTFDVFDQWILETKVDVVDSILIEAIPILTIRFPKIIKDGSKRKVFRKVIHDIMELHPNGSYGYVLNFIKHINENFASPKMEGDFLKQVVKGQFNYIRNQEGYKNKSKKPLRVIHYEKNIIVKSSIKKKYANQIRGVLDGYLTHKKIVNAINYLLDEHGDYVYQDIANIIEVSPSTVKRHIHKEKIDYQMKYDEIITEVNNHITFLD